MTTTPASARRPPTPGRARWAVVSLAALAALVVGAVRAELPPIADPPTGEHRHGKFVWIDLVTADIAGARRFYGGGWYGDGLGLVLAAPPRYL